MARPRGGAVVLNVKTGAVEAMYSNPTYNPAGLVSPTPLWRRRPGTISTVERPSPLVSRTFQFGFLPGSTFKTVTSAAVYDRQPPWPTSTTRWSGASAPAVGQTAVQLRPQRAERPEQCGGVLTTTLPRRATRPSPSSDGPRGHEPDDGGASLRVQPAHPLDLPGVGVSNFPTIAQLTDNAPSQPTRLRAADVTATALQMALVADGIANGRHHDPACDVPDPGLAGEPRRDLHPKPWLTATSSTTATPSTRSCRPS